MLDSARHQSNYWLNKMETDSTFRELRERWGVGGVGGWGGGEERRGQGWACGRANTAHSESHFLSFARGYEQGYCESVTLEGVTVKLKPGICVKEKIRRPKSTETCWVFMVEGPACTEALGQEGPSTLMKLKETHSDWNITSWREKVQMKLQ